MSIWSGEIKELEKLYESVSARLPLLGKELDLLIKTQDANVVMLYARRCLEVIVTDLCENELKRPRKTEPLKGIIDKLNSEEKVPSHIITSMHGLNSLSTFGTHPKDFDTEQVKPALSNLSVIIKWFLAHIDLRNSEGHTSDREKSEIPVDPSRIKVTLKTHKKVPKTLLFTLIIFVAASFLVVAYLLLKQPGDYSKLEKSIAVIPFRNDSPDDSTQYFMDGVMEELLTNLQRIKDLRVLGRTSVEQYRNQTKPIPEIAKELGVNYLVEGSGQRSGNSLRMRVQLIMAKKERHLWANSFEQDTLKLNEYFKIQSQFAENIANELNAVITPGEKHLIEKIPTEKIDAYDAFLKGQIYFRKLTPNDLTIALKYFESAIETDPDYAPAYAGISFAWTGLVQIGNKSPDEAGPIIMGSLTKALELDSTLAEVQYTLALVKTWVMWDWNGGETAFKKALESNPNYSEARAYYSHFLNMMGRTDEARTQIEQAIKLDPLNPLIKSLYAVDLLFFRQYDEARNIASEVLKMDPTAPVANFAYATALHMAQRYDEAINAIKETYIDNYNLNPDIFDSKYTRNGYKNTLEIFADTLIKQLAKRYIAPMDIIQLFVFSGNNERAFEWLERGFNERDQNMPYLLLPMFDNIRNDPRFKELSRKMNLPYK